MRLLALLRQIPKNGSVSIPEETRADLRWWRCFMEKYNGISMMPDSPWSEPDQVFATDACLEGCGGWCSGNFFHGKFPQFIMERHLHINALELLTVMVALKLWGKLFRGKRISILCDNIASVMVLNRGITRDKFQAQCLREITFITAVGEFQVRAQHIPGTDNRIPDILSRWHSFQDPCWNYRSSRRALNWVRLRWIMTVSNFPVSGEGVPNQFLTQVPFTLAFWPKLYITF